MSNLSALRFTAVSHALPSALVIWRLGSRLLSQAGANPSARRWARIGATAAAVSAIAAIAVQVVSSASPAPKDNRDLNDRLEHELEDTFPASDPPAVTRPHRA
jgi:hypothetical protein